VGIKIKNYRSYRSFPENGYLKIGNFTTLVGKNNVGKSNLLRAIKIVCENERLSETDIHKGIKEDCEISLFFEIPEELADKVKDEFEIEDKIVETKMMVEWDDNKQKLKNNGRGRYFLNDNAVPQSKIKKILDYLPKPIFVEAMREADDEFKLKRGTVTYDLFEPIIEKTESIIEKLKNLETEIKRVIDSMIESRIKSELCKMWDDVEDVEINLELALKKAFEPEILIKEREIGDYLPVTHKGCGIQRYLILALLNIYREFNIGKGYLLLFEVPELYLHVGAQKKMCSILKDLSKEGQVIVSTHSHIFVDQSDMTYLLVKENGETKVRNYENLKEILSELGIAPSDLYLTNGIILVEGPSDVEIFKIFAKVIFKNWDEYNIAIIPIGGSNIEHIADALKDIKLDIHPNIAVILDSDVEFKTSASSDLREEKRKLKKKFKKVGIKVYFWRREDGI